MSKGSNPGKSARDSLDSRESSFSDSTSVTSRESSFSDSTSVTNRDSSFSDSSRSRETLKQPSEQELIDAAYKDAKTTHKAEKDRLKSHEAELAAISKKIEQAEKAYQTALTKAAEPKILDVVKTNAQKERSEKQTQDKLQKMAADIREMTIKKATFSQAVQKFTANEKKIGAEKNALKQQTIEHPIAEASKLFADKQQVLAGLQTLRSSDRAAGSPDKTLTDLNAELKIAQAAAKEAQRARIDAEVKARVSPSNKALAETAKKDAEDKRLAAIDLGDRITNTKELDKQIAAAKKDFDKATKNFSKAVDTAIANTKSYNDKQKRVGLDPLSEELSNDLSGLKNDLEASKGNPLQIASRPRANTLDNSDIPVTPPVTTTKRKLSKEEEEEQQKSGSTISIITSVSSSFYRAATGKASKEVEDKYQKIIIKYADANIIKGKELLNGDREFPLSDKETPKITTSVNKDGKTEWKIEGKLDKPFEIIVKDKNGRPTEAITIGADGKVQGYKQWDSKGRESSIPNKNSAFDKQFLAGEMKGMEARAVAALEKSNVDLAPPIVPKQGSGAQVTSSIKASDLKQENQTHIPFSSPVKQPVIKTAQEQAEALAKEMKDISLLKDPEKIAAAQKAVIDKIAKASKEVLIAQILGKNGKEASLVEIAVDAKQGKVVRALISNDTATPKVKDMKIALEHLSAQASTTKAILKPVLVKPKTNTIKSMQPETPESYAKRIKDTAENMKAALKSAQDNVHHASGGYSKKTMAQGKASYSR